MNIAKPETRSSAACGVLARLAEKAVDEVPGQWPGTISGDDPAETIVGLAELCNRKVATVFPDMVLSQAAALMRREHDGCLVVVGEDTHGRTPIGILTDRDIVEHVVANGLDARELSVGDVMQTDLAMARDDDSVLDALRLMRTRGVWRLPVIDARGRLAGLLGADDLLAVLAGEMRAALVSIDGKQAREGPAQR